MSIKKLAQKGPHLCKENNISYCISDMNDAMYAESGAKAHIKVDSGMNRLGFKYIDEFLTAIDILLEKGAEIEGGVYPFCDP